MNPATVRVIWSPQAEQERTDAVDYIAEDSVMAALRFDDRCNEVTSLLVEQPFVGRPGAIEGTREFVVTPSYRLVYTVGENTLVIDTLSHTSLPWPPLLD